MIDSSHAATDPARSCSVLASADTGKTWQLVARLTRLLLHGARLDSILAITFTRKAAGEMQQRLNERLRELLEADDNRLDELLAEIGEKPTPDLRRQARGLFESTLRSEQRLRARIGRVPAGGNQRRCDHRHHRHDRSPDDRRGVSPGSRPFPDWGRTACQAICRRV